MNRRQITCPPFSFLEMVEKTAADCATLTLLHRNRLGRALDGVVRKLHFLTIAGKRAFLPPTFIPFFIPKTVEGGEKQAEEGPHEHRCKRRRNGYEQQRIKPRQTGPRNAESPS